MEFLQTIWNAITTENMVIVKFMSIPLIVIEAIITTLLFTTILDISSSKKQKIIYISCFSFIAIISIFFVPIPFNTYLNVIACPILVYIIFKTNILKSLLAEIIPYIIFVLLGSIFVNLYANLAKVPTYIINNIPIYRLIFSALLYICAYLIYLMFKNFNINIKLINKFKKGNSRILLLNFFIGILAIGIQSYIIAFYNDYLPFYITISSVIVLFVYFIISMFSLARTSKLETTTADLEEEKLYNKILTVLYEKIRGFKHDFNNIVQSIGGYIATDNMQGLKEYYSDLMSDCQIVNNLAVLNPELINNPAIYSLITSKYHKAENLGIKMNFDVFLNFKNMKVKIYDLTRILGILLDNAIEAASKCTKKEIFVTIRKDNKANRHVFIIENTYINKDVDTERIFEKGYTSKTDDNKNHGIGLWEVRKILSNNNNLNLFTTKDDNLFTQQLEIYF